MSRGAPGLAAFVFAASGCMTPGWRHVRPSDETEPQWRVVKAGSSARPQATGGGGRGVGAAEHPFGIEVRPGTGGLVVVSVRPRSAAETAGLRARDTLVALNGYPLGRADDLWGILGATPPGHLLRFAVNRYGARDYITATAVEKPTLAAAPQPAASTVVDHSDGPATAFHFGLETGFGHSYAGLGIGASAFIEQGSLGAQVLASVGVLAPPRNPDTGFRTEPEIGPAVGLRLLYGEQSRFVIGLSYGLLDVTFECGEFTCDLRRVEGPSVDVGYMYVADSRLLLVATAGSSFATTPSQRTSASLNLGVGIRL